MLQKNLLQIIKELTYKENCFPEKNLCFFLKIKVFFVIFYCTYFLIFRITILNLSNLSFNFIINFQSLQKQHFLSKMVFLHGILGLYILQDRPAPKTSEIF